jgi:hypothetical protein
MFNRLAKIGTLARFDPCGRHPVAVPAAVHHNDNHADRRLAAVAARRRLTCHWEKAADGRLECHWQTEPPDETSEQAPGPSFMTGQKPAARRRPARRRLLSASADRDQKGVRVQPEPNAPALPRW